MFKAGDRVEIFLKRPNTLLGEFTASQKMCRKLFARYVFFKYRKQLAEIYWRKVN